MAKQTEFPHPPQGHVSILAWDETNKRWQAVYVSEAGLLSVAVPTLPLPDGAATELKQLPDGHAVTVDNVSLAVTGAFYLATQPVSASALPLPDGAATELKQLPDGHAVTVDNTDLEVFQDTPGSLLMGQHQYDGDAWHKSNLLFGYYDRWAFSSYDDASGTGDAEVLSDVVDEGYIHIVQSVAAHQDSGAPKQLTIYLYAGATSVAVYDDLAAISGKYHSVFIDAVLKEGDYVKAVLVTPGDGKRLRFRVWGYKMKIDM